MNKHELTKFYYDIREKHIKLKGLEIMNFNYNRSEIMEKLYNIQLQETAEIEELLNTFCKEGCCSFVLLQEKAARR